MHTGHEGTFCTSAVFHQALNEIIKLKMIVFGYTICPIEYENVNYHRRRLLPDGFFPAEGPTYSRCHGMLGRLHPRKAITTITKNFLVTIMY